MQSGRLRRITRAGVVLFALSWCRAARAQETASDTTYQVRGTVVDTVTGHPIARALVASPDRRLATMTDTEGHFTLAVVVPAKSRGTSTGPSNSLDRRRFGLIDGTLQLSAQKPGFLAPTQPDTFQLDETLSARNIQLKLKPGGVVAGRVYAAGVNAPHNVYVSLLRHQVQEGDRTWNQTNVHMSDVRGEFRFTGLEPGEYTVMSGEWRGDEPQPLDPMAITQQYPPDFAGDVSSLAAATKLHLLPGDVARVELHLHRATYYPVDVPTDLGQGGGLNVTVETDDAISGFTLGVNGSNRHVLGALPNGTYTLTLNGYSPQGTSFAVLPLHVAGAPVHTGVATLAPPGNLSVRVHAEFTGQTSGQGAPNVNLSLRPDRQNGPYLNGSSRPDETEFVVGNVQPGSFRVLVQSSQGYVAAVRSGTVDLLRDRLVIGPNGAANPIDITLRDDGGMLTGTVLPGGKPLPEQCFILLTPVAGDGTLLQGYARGSEGKWAIGNIPPGSYRLFASPVQPGSLPFHDGEAMRVFDTKGVAVEIKSGGVQEADAPLLSEAEIE